MKDLITMFVIEPYTDWELNLVGKVAYSVTLLCFTTLLVGLPVRVIFAVVNHE